MSELMFHLNLLKFNLTFLYYIQQLYTGNSHITRNITCNMPNTITQNQNHQTQVQFQSRDHEGGRSTGCGRVRGQGCGCGGSRNQGRGRNSDRGRSSSQGRGRGRSPSQGQNRGRGSSRGSSTGRVCGHGQLQDQSHGQSQIQGPRQMALIQTQSKIDFHFRKI